MPKFKEILKHYRERQRVINVLNSSTTKEHIEVSINYLKAFKSKWDCFLKKDIILYLKYKNFEQEFYAKTIVVGIKMV